MPKSIGTTTSGKPVPDVTAAAYTTRQRMSKWNIEPTALHEPKILKHTLPGWTREDHEDAAEAHELEAARLQEKHSKLQDAADKKYGDGGNPYAWVSGGIREHWPRKVKDQIGNMARKVGAHERAASAHRAAMRFRS